MQKPHADTMSYEPAAPSPTSYDQMLYMDPFDLDASLHFPVQFNF